MVIEEVFIQLLVSLQVPSWIACARSSWSIVDTTLRTTRLVTAGEILAFQAMAGMYKIGMLLRIVYPSLMDGVIYCLVKQ